MVHVDQAALVHVRQPRGSICLEAGHNGGAPRVVVEGSTSKATKRAVFLLLRCELLGNKTFLVLLQLRFSYVKGLNTGRLVRGILC